MAYPSTLSTFTYPNANDKLSAPSHSSIESMQSSTISQLETFVGTLSSVNGTLVYDIRAASSDGGGHVQTANKGGTGQTSYNKGDILVATSSSVLTKLAVGSDNYVLRANSSAASGVNWSQETNILPKLGISGSVQALTNSTSETSLLSVSIPASTLGTNNAIRATLYIGNLNGNSADDAVVIRANYGGSTFGAITIGSIANSTASIAGTIGVTLIANNAQNSQRAMLQSAFVSPTQQPSIFSINKFRAAVPAIDSGAVQTLGITAQWNLTSTDNDLNTNGFIVEKIA